MAISELAFGKNLRPSTVDTMNKVNEIIAVVNELDTSGLSQVQSDVSTLKTQMSSMQTTVSNHTSSISNLTSKQNAMETDIDNIKVTLYTPLSTEEEE